MPIRVNIDVARLRKNRETGATEPVIRIVRNGEVSFAYTLEILGPSCVVYDPTRSGTSCWIETDSEVIEGSSFG
jgi:hypothetical protein